MSFWGSGMVYELPALLFTGIGLYLRRASRDPAIPLGDAVLVDLGLGIVVVVASVLWLQVLLSVVF